MSSSDVTAAGQQFQPQKHVRRSRIPLSCDPCRTRKLRCNREEPCQNCDARDQPSDCKYAGTRQAHGGSLRHTFPDENKHQMQQRIKKLEALVQKLVASSKNDSNVDAGSYERTPTLGSCSVLKPPTSDGSNEGELVNSTIVDGNHSVYKGADDWVEVMQEIKSLKSLCNSHGYEEALLDAPAASSHNVDGSSLLFRQTQQTDMLEILSTMPLKPKIDQLISVFFDESFQISVPPILHQPTFMREYAEHWKEPSQTNAIWLGLLFSVMSITMLSFHQYGEPPEYQGISEPLFQLYRLRTAQCLIIGDIAKCLPYTLETLRFNATAEHNRKEDTSRGLWIMTGVMMRTAISMGYHRELSSSSRVSVLQAEYRRRVWLSVVSMDNMASFYKGFPRMLPEVYSNTAEPRNLHDWELTDGATTLPSSRPMTEETLITYMILKGRLFGALGRIVDFNNLPGQSSYDTVTEIDLALLEAHKSFPPHSCINGGTTTSDPISTKASLSRLSLEFMYHRGMCTLHRRFLTKDRLSPRYQLSRERCITSATALLSIQEILEPSWYRMSQTRQTLTLAAMILFLELEQCRVSGVLKTIEDNTIFIALKNSCQFWENAVDSGAEAQKFHRLFSGMLTDLQNLFSTGTLTPILDGASFEVPGPRTLLQKFNNTASWIGDELPIPDDIYVNWDTWEDVIESDDFGGNYTLQL